MSDSKHQRKKATQYDTYKEQDHRNFSKDVRKGPSPACSNKEPPSAGKTAGNDGRKDDDE